MLETSGLGAINISDLGVAPKLEALLTPIPQLTGDYLKDVFPRIFDEMAIKLPGEEISRMLEDNISLAQHAMESLTFATKNMDWISSAQRTMETLTSATKTMDWISSAQRTMETLTSTIKTMDWILPAQGQIEWKEEYEKLTEEDMTEIAQAAAETMEAPPEHREAIAKSRIESWREKPPIFLLIFIHVLLPILVQLGTNAIGTSDGVSIINNNFFEAQCRCEIECEDIQQQEDDELLKGSTKPIEFTLPE